MKIRETLNVRKARLVAHLVAGDFLAYLVTTLLLDVILTVVGPLLGLGIDRPSVWLGGVVLVLSNAMAGVYDSFRLDRWETVRRRVIGLGVFFVTMLIVIGYDSASWPYLPSLVLIALILLVVSHFIESALRGLPSLRNAWTSPAVVLCRDAEARRFADFLTAHPEIGLSPRIVDLAQAEGAAAAERPDDPAAAAAQAGALDPDARLEALLADLDGAAARSPEVVILTNPADLAALSGKWARGAGGPEIMLAQSRRSGLSIRERSRALGSYTGFSVEASPLYSQSALLMKRALDLPIAIIAGLLALPIIALAALFIVIVDPGSPFYTQTRIGRNGRPFSILKLRSMYRDADVRLERHLAENPEAAEEWKRFFKLRDDPRILPFIGSIIRRTSIDELPQIWNIVKGDMSVVGPRPFPSYHLDSFDNDFQAIRASVPPGLTGYWQVTERSDGDLAAQQECDLYYIRNWSIWFDLYLILQTVPAVLTGHGAR